MDVETPLASIVREVDALSLNHHGNRDATNATFLRVLNPRVIVQQSWVSDQPGGEVVHRLASKDIWIDERDVFATNVAEEALVVYGPIISRTYDELSGHVVIRVAPGGATFDVFALEDEDLSLKIKAQYGPYKSEH